MGAENYGRRYHLFDTRGDAETGRTSIKRCVATQDVGTAINPTLVEGQMEGAVQQGLGFALNEKIFYDKETGEVLNNYLIDYKIRTAADEAKIETVIIPTYEPTGPFGAKGCGEVSLCPVAPAVANAIYDATGMRMKELPITLEKLHVAIKQRMPK